MLFLSIVFRFCVVELIPILLLDYNLKVRGCRLKKSERVLELQSFSFSL